MSNTPTPSDRWPALLLLGVAVFGPPSIAVLKFTQAVTQNPRLTAGLIRSLAKVTELTDA